MVMPQQGAYGQNPLLQQQQVPQPKNLKVPTWLFWVVIAGILIGAYFLIF